MHVRTVAWDSEISHLMRDDWAHLSRQDILESLKVDITNPSFRFRAAGAVMSMLMFFEDSEEYLADTPAKLEIVSARSTETALFELYEAVKRGEDPDTYCGFLFKTRGVSRNHIRYACWQFINNRGGLHGDRVLEAILTHTSDQDGSPFIFDEDALKINEILRVTKQLGYKFSLGSVFKPT